MLFAKQIWSSSAFPTSLSPSLRFSGWWTAWRRHTRSSPLQPFTSPLPISPVAPTGARNASPSPPRPSHLHLRNRWKHKPVLPARNSSSARRLSPATKQSRLLSISSANSAFVRSWNALRPENGHTLAATHPSHPADQQLPLVNHLRWQMVVHIDEQLFVPNQLLAPRRAIHFLHLVELRARNVDPRPFHIVVVGRPANGRLLALRASMHPVHNPLQYAHVFAEARPQKLPVLALRSE